MNMPRKWLAPSLCAALLLGAITLSAQKSSPPPVVHLPGGLTAEVEQRLAQQGIQVLYAYGQDHYLLSDRPSSVPSSQKTVHLPQPRISSELLASAGDKQTRVAVDLVLTHPSATDHLGDVLAKAQFEPDAQQVDRGTTLRGTVALSQLPNLLAHPFVVDATPALDDEQPYNFECRIGHGLTPLNSGIPGAPALNGDGIVIGVGDGGSLSGHPDVGDRVVHSTPTYLTSWGNHPDMVTGIIGGAGNVDPRQRGAACEAEFVIDVSSGIVYRAPTYFADYGLTITNNSYGPSFSCVNRGRYYGAAASIDNQLFDTPELMHVYAVGNSGRYRCDSLELGYGTVPAGGQVGKNSLAVGNISFERDRYRSSTAGPTHDGRLKPEIVGVGKSVTSLDRTQGYSTGNGTSFSAPGVAAALGLLSQRYQQLHPGILPDGALLKTLACNTAEDLGNPGPDYIFGFGVINSTQALRAVEEQRYDVNTLSQGATATKALSVTAGTEQLKVMLYWPDKAGPTTNDRRTLVNDFDLKLVTPTGDTLQPWILDPVQPQLDAVRGRDTLNNIEQVTLSAPPAGNYTVLIEATTLPLGQTDYYLTWTSEQPEVMLTCPYGGEVLDANANNYIAWTASSGQTGTWLVEQREVGGNWQTIEANVATEVRHLAWTPPTSSAAYEVRVTNNSTGLADMTNEAVEVLGSPQGVTAIEGCDGSLHLRWNAVTDATQYSVYAFDGNQMISEQVVVDTQYLSVGHAAGTELLYAVAAHSPSGKTGMRSIGVIDTASHNGSGCYDPLPVEWVGVQAVELAPDVRISWQVASERGSSHYLVQRGLPLGDTLGWETVVRVESQAGDAQDVREYQAYDRNAPEAAVIYYRVSQVDLDGASNLSEVVSVQRSTSQTRTPQALTLSQNPVGEVLRVHNRSDQAMIASLMDFSGRVLKTFELASGANAIQWPSRYTSGMYLLSVEGPNGPETLRLVK